MAFPTILDPERLHELIDAIHLIETDADLNGQLTRINEAASRMMVAQSRRIANGDMVLTREQVADAKHLDLLEISEKRRLQSLSPQERRVLDLLSEGLSNREIADTMFLAEKTVKNYVSHMLAKLGFQRRTEAALYSQRHQGHVRMGY